MLRSGERVQDLVVRVRRVANPFPGERYSERRSSVHDGAAVVAVQNDGDLPGVHPVPSDLRPPDPTAAGLRHRVPGGLRRRLGANGAFEDPPASQNHQPPLPRLHTVVAHPRHRQPVHFFTHHYQVLFQPQYLHCRRTCGTPLPITPFHFHFFTSKSDLNISLIK